MTAQRTVRFTSIDILRSIAVLLMIQTHFVENLSARQSSCAWLYNISQCLCFVPAPLFTFASGFSFGLWVRKQRSNRIREAEITRVAVRRGLFLFGLGIAFNVFVWLPEGTFNWDILTFIGGMLVILAFARSLPSSVLTLVCLVALLLSPPLRVVADYAAYWEEGSYEYDFTSSDVAFGFFLNGYFPLLPWIIFSLSGFVLTESISRNAMPVVTNNQSHSSNTKIRTIAIAMMCVAGLGNLQNVFPDSVIVENYVNGVSMFPASTQYVIGMLGLCVLSFSVLHQYVDHRQAVTVGAVPRGLLSTGIRRFSVFSLTVYILHHIVHLWPLWFYGAWKGHDDPTFYWQNAVETPVTLMLTVLCIVFLYFSLGWLERHPRYSFESLMRWLCD